MILCHKRHREDLITEECDLPLGLMTTWFLRTLSNSLQYLTACRRRFLFMNRAMNINMSLAYQSNTECHVRQLQLVAATKQAWSKTVHRDTVNSIPTRLATHEHQVNGTKKKQWKLTLLIQKRPMLPTLFHPLKRNNMGHLLLRPLSKRYPERGNLRRRGRLGVDDYMSKITTLERSHQLRSCEAGHVACQYLAGVFHLCAVGGVLAMVTGCMVLGREEEECKAVEQPAFWCGVA